MSIQNKDLLGIEHQKNNSSVIDPTRRLPFSLFMNPRGPKVFGRKIYTKMGEKESSTLTMMPHYRDYLRIGGSRVVKTGAEC
jgi:hypothetical protein